MWAILSLLVLHWSVSIFGQSFFHHRYGAHRMFQMSPFWERFFYVFTFIAQAPSFLVPRAYAILHRQHHAFSDTEKDPHSPLFWPNAGVMMLQTKHRYDAYAYKREEPEARFDGGVPEWPFLDKLSQHWGTRVFLGGLFVLFYLRFAPTLWWFLLLPIHWLLGPIHGAIVNWCGHKYGYTNYDNGDHSKNTLIFDFVTCGELFQNNHHKFGMSPNFGVRWFELDPCYQVMKLLNLVGIIDMSGAQVPRYPLAPVAPATPE